MVTDKHIEHGIAKPLALALVAFPVTAPLVVWLVRTGARRRFVTVAGTTLLSAWYLVLVSLFQ